MRTPRRVKISAARPLGAFGVKMENCGDWNATGSYRSLDTNQEMEFRLRSLQSLVCELLKTNQELRVALEQPREGLSRIQGQ